MTDETRVDVPDESDGIADDDGEVVIAPAPLTADQMAQLDAMAQSLGGRNGEALRQAHLRLTYLETKRGGVRVPITTPEDVIASLSALREGARAAGVDLAPGGTEKEAPAAPAPTEVATPEVPPGPIVDGGKVAP